MTTLSHPLPLVVAARRAWLFTILAISSLVLGSSSAAIAQVTAPAPAAAAKSSETAGKDAPVVLSVFEVASDKDEGYRSTQTVSGARTLANLRDTPISISVMNRELINDLMATTTTELSMFSVTGEQETNRAQTIADSRYSFRGITSVINLRNGVYWIEVADTYNLERVEILRGPISFLYGESSPGGLMNQLTKQAVVGRSFENLNLFFGSYNLHRAEFDLNRSISKKLAVRAALAYHKEDGFQNHVNREFRAAYGTVNYRPFDNTNINLSMDYGRNMLTQGTNLFRDQFDTYARTDATGSFNATTGGWTLIPATGQIYNTVGLRRTTGTNLIVINENLAPRKYNVAGPNAYNRQYYGTINLNVNQQVAKNLNLQFTAAYHTTHRDVRQTGGASAGAILLDANPTLPGGTANPYFNQYYTEYYLQTFKHKEPMRHARITAVYDLKLPFNTQRIVANASYDDKLPEGGKIHAEFVDPKSPYFNGTLINASTLAAYQANNTTMNNNRFYRRFYLRQGDDARITSEGPILGRSILGRDFVSHGGTGRLMNRLYWTPSYGVGSSGTYFNERLHSLVGWRQDNFNQDPQREFYNYATGELYQLPSTIPVRTRIKENSHTYGAVVKIADFLSAYYNYAMSTALSTGIGGAGLIPGTVRGPQLGDGTEYGLRWSLLGGRLESNWTYYVTTAKRNGAGIPAEVLQTELGALFRDLDPTGTDTQSTKASGVEFETVANLTKNWRLTWNYAENELETSDRYPQLKVFHARAKAAGTATPVTDAFLASVPAGTPLAGFTKVRSNLVTNYIFTNGFLKGFSIGGGAQYREESYQGNFDRNRDGVAEQLWTPGYVVANLMLGYRTKIRDRNVAFNFNINNLLDKNYYRAFSLSSGSWSDGRTFRFGTRIEL